jgi:hypothetical protein
MNRAEPLPEVELVEPTVEDWRRLYYAAKAELAVTTDPEMKTVRLLLCTAIETILATLEAGEAPAPVPALPPSVGEGGGGNHPRPWPPAPQEMEQATKSRRPSTGSGGGF